GEIYVVGLGGSVHRLAAPAVAAPVSAASYRGKQFAPQSIAAAFGQNFSTSTELPPANQPLPTTLAGASVKVIDAMGISRPAPLFFVSPTQINFLIPRDAAPGNGSISFTNTNGTISGGAVKIANVSPGLFTVNASGTGPAAALALRIKANGSQIYEPIVQLNAQNQLVLTPIDLGPDLGSGADRVFLVAFGSGFRFRSSLAAVAATVGGLAAPATFAGAQPDFPGLDPANILLPRSLIGRGDLEVGLMVDGQATNAVHINIK